jgi:hypothetical protein
MKFTFGAGVAVLAHKEQLELEIERVDSLTKQIDDQIALANGKLEAVSKIFEGDLQKLSNASGLTKNLTACLDLVRSINGELERIGQLQSERRHAIDCAKAALPDYTKWMTNGRLDVPPGGGSFFLASKAGGAGLASFEPPSPKQSAIDINKSLFDVTVARRFQR